MKVITPSTIDDSALTRTNISEDDATEYNPSTTYDTGDTAMLAASNKWYEALENGIIGVSPDSDPIKWLDRGATRPWRMFDAIIGSPTIGNAAIPEHTETGISVDVTPANRFRALAAFGLDASYVDVRVITSSELASDLTSYVDQAAFLVDWTIGSGITFDAVNDKIDFSASSGSANETVGILVDDSVQPDYIVTFDATVSSGSIKVQLYDGTYVDQLTVASTGSYEVVVDRSLVTSNQLFFTGVSFTGSIENISVRQLTYNETHFVGDDLSAPDWYNWYFEDIERSDTLAITDMPLSSIGDVVRVNARKGSTNATIGELVIGSISDLGISIEGVSVGIKDYSRKEVDAFGNFIITQRRFADIMSVDFIISTQDNYYIKKILTALRTTPAVWIAEETYKTTIIYGYYKSFDIIIAGEDVSDASIEIEGLI